jgi:hypothetical protein
MKRKILIALLVLVLLATGASATFWDRLVEMMMEAIIPWVAKYIFYPFMTISLGSLKGLLYFNPTVMCFGQPGCRTTAGIDALRPYIMEILVPFYVVALMFVAMFMITKSGSPRGRARAKKMFLRLIIGMLFVIYAPFIYQMLLDISELLTKFYLDQVELNKLIALTSFGKAISMCYLQCCMFLVVLITACILIVRWLSVYIYGLFFPLIMFLYFFEITQPYGSKYAKQALKWIFVPPLQALILYAMVNGPLITMGAIRVTGLGAPDLQLIFTQMIAVFMVLSGMGGMCAAPMIMTHILSFMGKLIYSFGLVVDSLPLMSIGGVIQGQGGSAFSNAHAHFSRTRAYEAAQSASFGGAVAKEAPKAMRMAGSQRGPLPQQGPIEGHGGAGGGAYRGGGGLFGGTAAARRGITGMPSIESELDEVRKTAKTGPSGGGDYGAGREIVREESSESVAEERDATAAGAIGETAGKKPARSVFGKAVPQKTGGGALGYEPTAAPDESGERISAVSRSDIDMARDEQATGLSPADLEMEREAAKRQGEGPYELLQGRGAASSLTGFSTASPERQSSMISRTADSINTLASAGVGSNVLNPLRGMLSDMNGIHRVTTVTKGQDELREGDLTVKSDLGERQKSLENNAAKARKEMATIQKQHFDSESVRKEIAHLQKLLAYKTEEEAKETQHKKKTA